MLNFNKNYQLFLSKKFEYFNAFDEINFDKNGLKKSQYTTPGTMFLTIFNNLDFILQTLQKSICFTDMKISSITNFIENALYEINPFLSNVITSEIESYYNSLDKKTSDSNVKEKTNDLIEDYVTNLMDSLIKYQYFFNMYFGIFEDDDLKKKDISYFQTIFNVKFKVPAYTIYACFESEENITPLSSNLPKKRIVECLDILKKDKKITYLNEYEITTLSEVLGIYFYFFTEENILLKRCANCGKYYIPITRSDSKYCDNISPQNPNKTCKDIGADLFHKNKVASDPILKEYAKTKGKLAKRISRASLKNDIKEKNKAQKNHDKFVYEYNKQLKKYQKNKLSEFDFISWIQNQN